MALNIVGSELETRKCQQARTGSESPVWSKTVKIKNARHLLLIKEELLCGSKLTFVQAFHIFEMLEMALSIVARGRDRIRN